MLKLVVILNALVEVLYMLTQLWVYSSSKSREINEEDLKLFEEHLKSKLTKYFEIVHNQLDGQTRYGVWPTHKSEFYIETFPFQYFDNKLDFIKHVNYLIEQGYTLI